MKIIVKLMIYSYILLILCWCGIVYSNASTIKNRRTRSYASTTEEILEHDTDQHIVVKRTTNDNIFENSGLPIRNFVFLHHDILHGGESSNDNYELSETNTVETRNWNRVMRNAHLSENISSFHYLNTSTANNLLNDSKASISSENNLQNVGNIISYNATNYNDTSYNADSNVTGINKNVSLGLKKLCNSDAFGNNECNTSIVPGAITLPLISFQNDSENASGNLTTEPSTEIDAEGFAIIAETSSDKAAYINSKKTVLYSDDEVTLDFTLNKCSCGKGFISKVSEDHACVQGIPSFIELLVEPITYKIFNVDESQFIDVQVKPINCSENERFIFIDDIDFLLLKNGNIRHETYYANIKHGKYCMENLEYEDGTSDWTAFACVSPIILNKCCPLNEYFDDSLSKCRIIKSSKNISSFQPPIEIDLRHPLDSFFDLKIETPRCEKSQQLSTLKIGNYSSNIVHLLNRIDEVKLQVIHQNFSYQKYYAGSKFCIETTAGTNEYFAQFCAVKENSKGCLSENNCYRKCCPENQSIDMITVDCQRSKVSNFSYKPRLYNIHWYGNMTEMGKDHTTRLEAVYGEPLCHPINAKTDNFYLLNDGSMYFSDDKMRYLADSYCIDNRQGYAGQFDTVVHYCEWHGQAYGDSCWR